MLLRDKPFPHRDQVNGWQTVNAAVSRPVSRAEPRENAGARKALKKAADGLAEIVWYVKNVRSWNSVHGEARRCGIKADMGSVRLVVLCVPASPVAAP